MKKKIWFWLIAVGVFVLDRVTKILAPKIPEGGTPLIPGVIGLRYAENTGMAFSMFAGMPWMLGVASLLIILVAMYGLRGRNLSPLLRTGLMMMLGGAAGNMVDRFIHGYVPDMIEFLFVKFAVFNVADSFLVIGCILVMAGLIFGKESLEKEA